MKQNKKIIFLVIALVIVGALAGFYISRRNQNKAPSTGPFQVPQVNIQNNPIQGKVPDVNPVGGSNPFKYKNPLLQ